MHPERRWYFNPNPNPKISTAGTKDDGGQDLGGTKETRKEWAEHGWRINGWLGNAPTSVVNMHTNQPWALPHKLPHPIPEAPKRQMQPKGGCKQWNFFLYGSNRQVRKNKKECKSAGCTWCNGNSPQYRCLWKPESRDCDDPEGIRSVVEAMRRFKGKPAKPDVNGI